MKYVHLWVATLCLASAVVGCTQHSLSSELQSDVQPFAQTRDQAVAVVRAAKSAVDPMGIDIVNVKYAALQQQANGYLGLVVESIDTGSFDQNKSAADAEALIKAIDGFNGSVAPLLKPSAGPTPPGTPAAPLPLPDQWVTRLQDDLTSSWPGYGKSLAAMTADQRTALGEQFKSSLAWPNFQDIAAGSATTHNGSP